LKQTADISKMSYSWLTGATQIEFTHSDKPLVLPTRNGIDRTLPDICKEVVPEANLHPLLVNGHLQTAYTSVKDKGPQIHYKRRVFASDSESFKGHYTVDYVVAPPPKAGTTAEDGGLDDQGLREDPAGVGHYRLPPRTTYFTDEEFANIGSDDTKPLLITLHGLSGGSYENYLRYVLEPIVRASPEGAKAGGLSGGDWEALVVNSRGCAGSKITTSLLYNARATWDMRQTVKWVRKTWPNRPLFAVGYSLGANILTNYLGEEGDKCVISAACVVANPWNLEVTSRALLRTYLGRQYSQVMGQHMLALYNRHVDQIQKNELLSPERIRALKYLHEFDREVQCASWGYPTEGAYYRDASSVDSLLSIRVPTLCLSAKDDPIANDEAVPYNEIRQNPYVVMCTTSAGGHLGWFEWNGRWHWKPITGFFNAMAREVDFVQLEANEVEFNRKHGGQPSPFLFESTRRKLHLPGDHAYKQ